MAVADLSARLIIMAVAFCLSAFFSAAETALFSFQPEELAHLKVGGRAARAAAALRSRPGRLLITVLFGNMLVNTVFYVVSFLLVLDVGPNLTRLQVVLLGLAPLLVIIIGGEVVPKNLAVTFYRPFGLAVALPLVLMQHAMGPAMAPLEKLADAAVALLHGRHPRVRAEELQVLVALSAREGAVEEGAARMIAEVVGLPQVRVSELMRPRVEMAKFDLNGSPEELIALFRRAKAAEVAVYDADPDEMRGVIRLKDAFLRPPDQTLRALVQPVPFLPETANAEDALDCCRRVGTRMAFVVDERGTVIGLVTVQDLLEEIVGEIADEHDPQQLPDIVPLAEGLYRLQGSVTLREWQEAMGVPLPDLGVETVGGFVMASLGHVPEVGDLVRSGDFEFTVESVRARAAATISVRRLPSEGAESRPDA